MPRLRSVPCKPAAKLASRRFQVVEDRLAEALYQQKEHSQAEAALHSVRLARYPESFELATGMRRRFIAILGPTNSGKTHQAMEVLAAAASGEEFARCACWRWRTTNGW